MNSFAPIGPEQWRIIFKTKSDLSGKIIILKINEKEQDCIGGGVTSIFFER